MISLLRSLHLRAMVAFWRWRANDAIDRSRMVEAVIRGLEVSRQREQALLERGAGYERDRARSNEAQALGWRVLEVTPAQVRDGSALAMIVRMAA